MQQNKSQIELADIFRKYGEDYRRSHFLSTEQSKTMYHKKYAVQLCLGDILKPVTTVVSKRMLTTHAGTGTARNARHL